MTRRLIPNDEMRARSSVASRFALPPPTRAPDRASLTPFFPFPSARRENGTTRRPETPNSDAFDLNERVCVELLVAAVERGAPPERCLQPAAGMFLRERQNRVECLERLLRQLGESRQDAGVADARLARVVDEHARDILKGSGGRTLIGRLCEILASPPPGDLAAAAARASGAYVVQTPGGSAATPGGGIVAHPGAAAAETPGLMTDAAIAAAAADMTHVVDERQRACRKKDWLAHERKLLARCLFRAVAVVAREPTTGSSPAGDSTFATREDFESLARLFAETASPVLATAAADVRARAAAMESGAAVGSGLAGSGPSEPGAGSGSGPSAARGGRFRSAGDSTRGFDEAPSAAEARVGCVDELGDLAAGVTDELPAALAILFATLEALTPVDGGDAGAASSEAASSETAAAAAAAVGPTLEAASAAAAAQFRRARDGDDADAAAEMAAANPLRSAALGGGFGGLMFGRSQDRSAADDAATEVSSARVGVLQLARFARGLTQLSSSAEPAVEAAKKEIVDASDDGALVALRCVLATGAFRDDDDAARRAYLALARETLRRGMRAALADADLGEALAAVTPAMTADQIAREERHAATADDAPPAGRAARQTSRSTPTATPRTISLPGTTCTSPRASVCARCVRMRTRCGKRRSPRSAERWRRCTARARRRRGKTRPRPDPGTRLPARWWRARSSMPSASGNTAWTPCLRRWRCWRRWPPRATQARGTPGNDCGRPRRARRWLGTTSSPPSPGITAGSRSGTSAKTRPSEPLTAARPPSRETLAFETRARQIARCPRRTRKAWWRTWTC